MTYEQDEVTGEHRPQYIRYGGKGLNSHAGVQFSYEARPDAWKRYIDETRNDLRSRVSHIKTYVGENLDGTKITENAMLVRDYTLTYEQSPTSGRTLLSSTGVCARHPASGEHECMPATTFAWGKPDPNKKVGFTKRGEWKGAPILTTHAVKGSNGLSPQAANHADYFAFSDFDHDGFSDVLEKRVASMRPADLDTHDGQVRESSNPIKPGTMQSKYRFFRNSGSGFTTYYYTIDSGEPFVVLDVGDFNGDGALDLFVYGDGAKICLSPLAQPNALGAAGSTVKFTCRPKVTGSWRNEPGGRAYVFDPLGDGRSAVYSAMRIGNQADFCNLDGCSTDTNPPYIVGLDQGFPFNPYDGDTEFAAVEYTSFTQMVDFTGIGKSYDTRWTEPFFQQYTYEGNEKLETNTWNNFTPEITMTSLGPPG